MARSDLVLDLVKAALNGDQAASRITAQELAAYESSKKHSGIANRITQIIQNSERNRLNGHKPLQSIQNKNNNGGFIRCYPDRPLSSLFFENHTRTASMELIEEQLRADLLRAHGIEPRHRLLLVGPPGNGKTSLAESIAYELSLPLLIVRYDSIITSYLGETALRLRKLFDFISTEPCVLFFDEFDAIGKERGDIHETGEIKRVVTTLLLQFDALPSYCVLVAATNHPELLDRASLRRFQIRLELGKPSDEQMEKYFEQKLNEFEDDTGFTAKKLLDAFKPENFSEAEDFFLDVRRRNILAQGNDSCKKLIEERISAWEVSIRNFSESCKTHDTPSDT